MTGPEAPSPEGEPLRIGVSACLIGQMVRYNGDHKRSRWATDELSSYCSFVPVCPEVEIGLGVPRPTIRLVQDGETVRLVEPKSGDILTGRMDRYSGKRARELEKQDLDGFILKKDSPSCGMERVKVHQPKGPARKTGVGRFAMALMERMPLLPVEEEGRLNDARLRENFVERLFAWRRVRELFRGRWTRGEVVRFHTAEKFLVLSHDRAAYTELGRLVARVKETPRAEFADLYKTIYMNGLQRIATTR
ncbi:MAG: YbgA family protein, partial [Planctomycetota bacterium]